MKGIFSGIETAATARFCPKCGGSNLTVGPGDLLAVVPSGPVKCSCGWEGRTEELVVAQFKHGFADDEQILQNMMADLRNLLAKEFAKSFGAFLLKWGFIPEAVTPALLGRYVAAVAKATLSSVIEVRREIEREKSQG